VAQRARYVFAAWYVQGNIERLQILLGHANLAARAIRKRLAALQERGATHDEIVARSNLAWALRCLGRHREALHELDAALRLTRSTGTFNVLLEFLHYDRSVVLDALGDIAGAKSSYRRYLRLVGGRSAGQAPQAAASAVTKRPLEPFFLKRADRFIDEHLDAPVGVKRVAEHCGVSWRTLQKAFMDSRGVTPVAYVRNLRLDRARQALEREEGSVAQVAARYGFGSATTFSLEYRKRFGMAPSRTREGSARPAVERLAKDAPR
jgi:AraC-like DNA-binding protein